jgi:biopolymer transport protein ExbD
MNNKHKLFIVFSLVIIFTVLWFSKSKTIENMENQEEQPSPTCCENNPLFLAMKNSADISVLKEQIKDITSLKEKVKTIETDVKYNTTYIEASQKEDTEAAQAIETQLDETNQISEEITPTEEMTD